MGAIFYSRLIGISILLWIHIEASSFTVEVTDRNKFCLFEEFKEDGKYIFEFRVLKGGNRDVDGYIITPNKQIPYKVSRVPKGFHLFQPVNGTYEFCVSNQFSSLAHKQVYMSIHRQEVLNRVRNKSKNAATLMEATTDVIYRNLNAILRHQKGFRMKQAVGVILAGEMHSRVGWWSVLQSLVILFAGAGQVFVLRKFFTFRKTDSNHRQAT